MGSRSVTINLGAGVQSTVLVLMAAHGDLRPLPEVAVFADTQEEPAGVYDHLAWLEGKASELTAGRLRIVRATAGSLGDDLIAAALGLRPRASNPPLFTRDPDGTTGMLPRGCTRDYKIRVIRAKLRDLGYGERSPVTSWIGFSLDEWTRMKPSDVAWQDLIWPLIDARMSRADCERWLTDRGYPVPVKSACAWCPYHDDHAWRRLRDEDPSGWARALEVDAAIRTGLPGLRGEAFLHRQRVPLAEVDLTTPEDRGQLVLGQCDAGAGCWT